MKMHNPPHPGSILSEIYIQPIGLSIKDTAAALGVSRQALSDLVNSKRGISVEMAMRLSIAFDTTPELWLNMQMQYDLWKASKKKLTHIKRLVARTS